MADLQRTYEELMARLEKMKTATRVSSRNGNRMSSSSIDAVGNSIFDVEFLERCQQCLTKQISTRRRSADDKTRCIELADVVKSLQQCLREYIFRTKIFVDTCNSQPEKASDGTESLLRRTSALQQKLKSLTRETSKAKNEMNRALEQSRLDKEILAETMKKSEQEKKIAELQIRRLSREKEEHRNKAISTQQSLARYRSEAVETKKKQEREIALLKEKLKAMWTEKRSLLKEQNEIYRKIERCEALTAKSQTELDNEKKRKNEIEKICQRLREKLSVAINSHRQLQNEFNQLHSAREKTTEQNPCSKSSPSYPTYEQSEPSRMRLLELLLELQGRICICCRIKPTSEKPFLQKKGIDSVSFDVDGKRKTCSFDTVFDAGATQDDVFSEVENLVQSAMDGHNVCFLSFGTSGSGKTHTIIGGDSDNDKGIFPRSVSFLMHKAQTLQISGWRFSIEVYVLAIRNEELKDVLVTDQTKGSLKIQYDTANGRILIPGAQRTTLSSTDDVTLLFNKLRQINTTSAHLARSHVIYLLQITGINERFSKRSSGSIYFVDLGGIRTMDKKRTDGCSNLEVGLMKRSLRALADVCTAVTSPQSHIPYGNSKLTRLLKQGLNRSSRAVMFVHLCPEQKFLSKSLDSLRYAKKIRPRNHTSLHHENMQAFSTTRASTKEQRTEDRSSQTYHPNAEDSMPSPTGDAAGKDTQHSRDASSSHQTMILKRKAARSPVAIQQRYKRRYNRRSGVV